MDSSTRKGKSCPHDLDWLSVVKLSTFSQIRCPSCSRVLSFTVRGYVLCSLELLLCSLLAIFLQYLATKVLNLGLNETVTWMGSILVAAVACFSLLSVNRSLPVRELKE